LIKKFDFGAHKTASFFKLFTQAMEMMTNWHVYQQPLTMIIYSQEILQEIVKSINLKHRF